MSVLFGLKSSEWHLVPFDNVFIDATGGNSKVKQSDYRSSGRLPVVDQGADEIGGYTDDTANTCLVQLPAILFGDHTKKFKFLTFPFALGADGVKVLDVREGWDKRFLFHYLRSIELPDVGYSRHFKFLKRVMVPKPPIDEQRRIAAILDKAEAIRRKRQQALTLADDFLRSAFLEMFGDPSTNSKGWNLVQLGDLGALERGRSTHRPRNAPELLGGIHPLIQTGDITNAIGGVIQTYRQTYSEIGLQQSRKWPQGTLCITIAANIADAAILNFDACFPDSVVGFTSDAETSEYVHGLLRFLKPMLEARAPQVAQKNINLEILRSLVVPSPSSTQKKRYLDVVRKWRGLFSIIDTTIPDTLFASLSQRAFRGEL